MTTVTTEQATATATEAGSDTLVNKLIATFVGVAIFGWTASAILTAIHFWVLPLPEGVEPQAAMAVITSQWAYVGPIPLATVGAAYYIAMIAAGATWYVTKHPLLEKAMLPLTGLGVLMSIGLVYLQLGPIGAICPFCMASAAATTTLFVLELIVRSRGGAAAAPRVDATRAWPITFIATMAMTMVAMWSLTVLPLPGN